MKPQFYINVTKKLLSLAFVFSLCFVVSCTNDDSDNEGDLDIITPGEENVLGVSQDIKADDAISNN
ncbi:MAG: hypothetical protein ABJJ25_14505 [Eudoraea sp.]|uniref:hypothetical protein n=1 Tax=Eudoraea sp. TaxID=1979955 RepID=UPI00326509C1